MRKLLLLFLIFLFSCSSDQTANLVGNIVVLDGSYIQEAEVIVYPLVGEYGLGRLKDKNILEISKSNKNGQFFLNIDPGLYTLSISKSGYKPVQTNLLFANENDKIKLHVRLSNKNDSSKISIDGFRDKVLFDQLLIELREIDKLQSEWVKYARGSEIPINDSIFSKVYDDFQSLTDQFNQPFKNIIRSKQFVLQSYYHPISFHFLKIRSKFPDDSTKVSQFLHSDIYKKYLNQCYLLLEDIDLKLPIVDISDFMYSLSELNHLY